MSSRFLLLVVATASLLAVSGDVACADRQADIDALVSPYLDSYGAPTASIQVSFADIGKVKFGKLYPKNLTQENPTVLVSGAAVTSGKFYSLITVDPDGPGPTSPTSRNVLHYFVSNIPGSIAPTHDVKLVGDVVNPWIGPQPPNGTHRYMFLLFDQGCRKYNITPYVRPKFSVRNFTSTFNLGFPLGGTLFRANAKY